MDSPVRSGEDHGSSVCERGHDPARDRETVRSQFEPENPVFSYQVRSRGSGKEITQSTTVHGSTLLCLDHGSHCRPADLITQGTVGSGDLTVLLRVPSFEG